MASATLSHDFTINLGFLYDNALKQLTSNKVIRQGINCHTMHAAPALVSSVAAVEAFLMNTRSAPWHKRSSATQPLWTLQRDWLQQLDVRAKLVIVPFLLFGNTFRRGEQPYQDFTILVKARNEVVHYKMEDTVPTYLRGLQQRKIALASARRIPSTHLDPCTLLLRGHPVGKQHGLRSSSRPRGPSARPFQATPAKRPGAELPRLPGNSCVGASQGGWD